MSYNQRQNIASEDLMVDGTQSQEANIAELVDEVKDLKKKLESLQIKDETRQRQSQRVRQIAYKFLVGKRLDSAIRGFLSRLMEDGFSKTSSEFADLIVAIVARFSLVAFLGFLAATTPAFILVWQTVLLRAQNISLERQSDEQYSRWLEGRVAEEYVNLHSEVPQVYQAAALFFIGNSGELEKIAPIIAGNVRDSRLASRCHSLNTLTKLRLMQNSLDQSSSVGEASWLRTLLPSRARLDSVSVVGLNCDRSQWVDRDYEGIDFHKMSLRNSELVLGPTSFFDSDLSGSVVTIRNFRERSVRMQNTILDGVILDGAVQNIYFSGSNSFRGTLINIDIVLEGFLSEKEFGPDYSCLPLTEASAIVATCRQAESNCPPGVVLSIPDGIQGPPLAGSRSINESVCLSLARVFACYGYIDTGAMVPFLSAEDQLDLISKGKKNFFIDAVRPRAATIDRCRGSKG